jgi:hypothetical protein
MVMLAVLSATILAGASAAIAKKRAFIVAVVSLDRVVGLTSLRCAPKIHTYPRIPIEALGRWTGWFTGPHAGAHWGRGAGGRGGGGHKSTEQRARSACMARARGKPPALHPGGPTHPVLLSRVGQPFEAEAVIRIEVAVSPCPCLGCAVGAVSRRPDLAARSGGDGGARPPAPFALPSPPAAAAVEASLPYLFAIRAGAVGNQRCVVGHALRRSGIHFLLRPGAGRPRGTRKNGTQLILHAPVLVREGAAAERGPMWRLLPQGRWAFSAGPPPPPHPAPCLSKNKHLVYCPL